MNPLYKKRLFFTKSLAYVKVFICRSSFILPMKLCRCPAWIPMHTSQTSFPLLLTFIELWSLCSCSFYQIIPVLPYNSDAKFFHNLNNNSGQINVFFGRQSCLRKYITVRPQTGIDGNLISIRRKGFINNNVMKRAQRSVFLKNTSLLNISSFRCTAYTIHVWRCMDVPVFGDHRT